MIHIDAENPLAVLKRTQHHARGLIPLVEALTTQLFFSELHTDEQRHHYLCQSRNGANSFGLWLDNYEGAQYHFRGGATANGYDHIKVYSRYMHGSNPPIFTLNNRTDCIMFVRAIVTKAYARKAA